MTDVVTSQTLLEGSNALVQKFTNASDGTGESAALKVDASAHGASELRLDKIDYHTSGMGVNLAWDATADEPIVTIGQNADGCLDFRASGGLRNNAGAGKTGDINFTTVGQSAGDAYTIVLHMRKIK